MKANKDSAKTNKTSKAKSSAGKSRASKGPAKDKQPANARQPANAQTAADTRARLASREEKARAASQIPHIDDETLSQIIDKLNEMRRESMEVVNPQRDPNSRPWDEKPDVGDDLDQASNERDREFNLIMHQRHLRRLQQIDEAFEKLEDGTYGFCEGTDEPINPRRLLIMPLARYSLEYQEHQEKMLGRSADGEPFSGADESFESED